MSIRAICVLLITVCTSISFTSPTPRQYIKDGAVIKSTHERYLRFVAVTLPYWRRILWLVAIAEVLAALARAFPSTLASDLILDNLFFGRGGSQIRMTMAGAAAVPLALVATILRVRCYRELGKHFTYELTIHKDHTLITTGPYSVVRHPSYTAFVMNVFALYLAHCTDGSWVRESGLMGTPIGRTVVYCFAAYIFLTLGAALVRMGDEDEELQRRFGTKWDEWASRVPFSLVPGII